MHNIWPKRVWRMDMLTVAIAGMPRHGFFCATRALRGGGAVQKTTTFSCAIFITENQ
jgi:hypothetical protein